MARRKPRNTGYTHGTSRLVRPLMVRAVRYTDATKVACVITEADHAKAVTKVMRGRSRYFTTQDGEVVPTINVLLAHLKAQA